jgi:hypothetical protein
VTTVAKIDPLMHDLVGQPEGLINIADGFLLHLHHALVFWASMVGPCNCKCH